MAAPAHPFPFTLQWKRLVGTPVPQSVVEAGDLAVFGEVDGTITAVRAGDGLRRWQARPGGPVGPGLAASDHLVVFADRWGMVGALEAESGETAWTARRTGWGVSYVSIVVDVAIIAGGDGVLYGLDLETGRRRWRIRTGLRPRSAPAVEGGLLFTATDDGLLRVEVSSGRRAASVSVARPPSFVTVAGDVVIASGGGYVRAYSLDLKPVWQRWLGTELVEVPQAYGDQLLCAGTNDYLYSLSPEDGSLRWSRALEARAAAAPVSTASADLVQPTKKGALLGFSDHGLQLWRQRLSTGTVRVWQGRKWLYAASGGYLHAFAPASFQAATTDTVWWESSVGGHKTGYGWHVWTEESDSLRLTAYAVGWRHGFVQLHSRTVLDRRSLALQYLRRSRVDASQVLHTRIRALGDSLRIERRLAESAQVYVVPTPAAVTVADAIPRHLRQHPMPPGRRDTILVLDPDSGVLRAIHAEVGASQHGHTRVSLRFGAALSPPPPAADDLSPDLLPDVELLIWLDEMGRQERVEAPSLATVERRVDAEQARAWTSPRQAARLRLDGAVTEPGRIDSLQIGLPGSLHDPGRLFVLGGRQSLRTDSTGSVLLVRRQPIPEQSLSVAEVAAAPGLAAYRSPSLYVQSAAPRIRELAAALVPDPGGSSWDASRRIHDWVYDHMVPTDTNVRFKSSLEVLEDLEGTCSEYTVLFAALGRAAGIPTRVTVGYAAGRDSSLVLHIWPQVFVGEWVEIDPSWNAFPVDGTHIKTGQGLLHPAHLERLNLPLERVSAVADTLALLAYVAEGQLPYSAQAERLHEVAERAARQYEEEAARQARYELVALSPNRRTGEALIALAQDHLDDDELDEAQWALDRLRRLGSQSTAAALYYMAQLSQQRGDPGGARELLLQLTTDHPDSDRADDALALLAAMVADDEGCQRARPLYTRLLESYSTSGWATVARAALRRCAEREALLEGQEGGRP